MTRPAVLVTGGAGYIGSHTCKALAQAGYLPVAFDNLGRGHRWAVRWGPLVEGDLGDRHAVERALHQHRVVAVIHFAADAYVGESMANPGQYFRNNVTNTLTLLDAMERSGIARFVFSSTCATYGVPVRVPIDENHPQCPVNPYGESKLMVERALHWYGQCHGLAWTALRYFNAAGADLDGEIGEDHDPETHLIPLAIDAALGVRPHLQILGTDYPTPDGTAIRDYIHVSDLADAHVAALRRLEAGGEPCALNLGTGQGHSVREVIAMVEAVTGRRIDARSAPRRPGDPPALVAAPGRAFELLGWQAQRSSLASIVASAHAWHLAHRLDAAPRAPAAPAAALRRVVV